MPILKRPHDIPAVPVSSELQDDDGKITQEWVQFFRAVADIIRYLNDVEVLARTSDWRVPVQAEITVDSDLLPVPDGTINLGGAGAKFNNAYLAGTVQADGGFNTSGTASNIIQAPNGGVYGKQVATDTAIYLLPLSSAPPASVPSGAYGGIGYKATSIFWYWNGSTWATVDLSAAGSAQSPWTGNINAASHTLYNVTSVAIGTATATSPLQVLGIPTFASDAAAGTGGLTTGAFWKDSSGNLHVKL